MRNVVLACLVVGSSVAALQGQSPTARPNFSGNWAYVGDPNGARGLLSTLSGLCGINCEIVSTATTMVIKRTPTSHPAMPEVLTFDWTQSRAFPAVAARLPQQVAWTSEWKGDQLLVSASDTRPLVGGKESRTDTTNAITLDGADLVIATTVVRTEQGAQGPAVSVVSKYRKVTTQPK